MSSDADAAAETVTLFYTLHTADYCAVAVVAFFIYDTFITFDREVACFWTAKRSGAALLYFTNKYISMLLFVMGLVAFAPFRSDTSCSMFQQAGQALQVLEFVPGAAFSALRAFVLSRSKFLGMLVFALSLAPAAVNLVAYGSQLSGQNFPPLGCLETNDVPAELDLRSVSLDLIIDMTGTDPVQGVVVIASRVPLIVSDILLVYITWTKLSSSDALKGLKQSRRLSLSDTLFRSGTVYFVVLFVLNGLHLALSATAIAGNGSANSSIVTGFTGPLTAILISRFLIALQEANQTVVRVDPNDPLHSSRDLDTTPSFISSLGGFVNPVLSARSDDDDASEFGVGSPPETAGEEEGGVQPETAGLSVSLSSTA